MRNPFIPFSQRKLAPLITWYPLVMLLCLAPAARSMDLLQTYDAARVHDATILASRAAATAGRERIPQAKAQMLPNVSASLSNNNNQLSSTSANILGNPQTNSYNYGSSNRTISVRQPLFRSQLMAQYRQAYAQVADSDAVLAQDEQTLALRVCSTYFDAMFSNEQLALVLTQRKTYLAQLDAARKSFAAGSGTRTDIDEAQARLDMNVALEIEARQQVAFALQQVEVLVNQPIKRLATLNVARLDLGAQEIAARSDWTSKAFLGNQQIKSLTAQVEVARQEVSKAKAGHHPTLDAVAQWSTSSSENVTSPPDSWTSGRSWTAFLASKWMSASRRSSWSVPDFGPSGRRSSQMRLIRSG